MTSCHVSIPMRIFTGQRNLDLTSHCCWKVLAKQLPFSAYTYSSISMKKSTSKWTWSRVKIILRVSWEKTMLSCPNPGTAGPLLQLHVDDYDFSKDFDPTAPSKDSTLMKVIGWSVLDHGYHIGISDGYQCQTTVDTMLGKGWQPWAAVHCNMHLIMCQDEAPIIQPEKKLRKVRNTLSGMVR